LLESERNLLEALELRADKKIIDKVGENKDKKK